jgi:Protein of unknown function (DUF992)
LKLEVPHCEHNMRKERLKNNRSIKHMKKALAIAATASALAWLAIPAFADAGVKVGVLTCRVEGGAGFLIGSAKGVDCKFKPAGGGKAERYTGSIGKLGIDIGVTQDTIIGWIVFAPGKMKAGALKGSYSGISAEATAGVGIGANVLVGGFRQSVNLQPVSVQAQTGLNVAAGIASLSLRYDR